MTMTQAAAGYFDRVAGDWDEIRAGYFTEAVRESAIAHAYLRSEMEVADVGSGTGFIAAGLAPLVSRVYALDGSPAMLDVARRNLAAYDNVVYQTTEGSALTLPDASVDAALANMYLHHCTDPAAAIREMARIVRPGGRLVITDMDRHEHEWMRAEMADEWLGFERAQVKQWLRDAGLVNVLVDCSNQSCCAASEATPDQRAEISVFVATGTRPVAGSARRCRRTTVLWRNPRSTRMPLPPAADRARRRSGWRLRRLCRGTQRRLLRAGTDSVRVRRRYPAQRELLRSGQRHAAVGCER